MDDSSWWRQVTNSVDVVGFEHLNTLIDRGPEAGELCTKPITDQPQPHALSASDIISARSKFNTNVIQ